MNSTSVGNASYPFPRSNQVGAQGSRTVSARGPQAQDATPGLRRLAGHRPNQAHAVLTYSITTLQRAGGAGANIDLYV